MKLVIILSRFPYPLDKGDKLRAFYQIKDLSRYHKIYLICLNNKKVEPKEKQVLDDFCEEIHVHRITKARQIINAGIALFQSRPIQVGMFYSKRAHAQIRKNIARIKPDHIFCQLIRVTEYAKKEHNIPKTVDYMDALSTGMMRMSRDSSWLMNRIYKIESRRLLKYENLIFDYFEHHTIISSQDRELIYHPDRKKIHIVPNGVDLEKLQALDIPKTYDLVFHGNMNYPPNVASAQYIGNNILPLLNPDLKVRVLISGTDPHPSVLSLASDSVHVSGWVEDIRTSFCSSKIFVAPMLINTGLQNKILEAMSLGIPCITTTLANNAIGAKPNEEIVIADTPEEFAQKITFLLKDETERDRIRSNALTFVRENCSWAHNNLKLSNIFLSK